MNELNTIIIFFVFIVNVIPNNTSYPNRHCNILKIIRLQVKIEISDNRRCYKHQYFEEFLFILYN